MSHGFTYSETSAFSPVPFELYDYTTATGTNIDMLSPVYEIEDQSLPPSLIDHWAAGLHQQSYETVPQTPYELGISPLSYLTHPYLHECFGEPGFIRKRNERERMRVRNVNEGYARLRDHLPLESTEKRMSKVETLRSAIKYIKLLESLLEQDKQEDKIRTVKLNENHHHTTELLDINFNVESSQKQQKQSHSSSQQKQQQKQLQLQQDRKHSTDSYDSLNSSLSSELSV